MKSIRPRTPEICPVCGEDVPPDAVACPACGADHDSGWREDAEIYDGVGLPEQDFNHDDFVKQEFGSEANRRALAQSGGLLALPSSLPLWCISLQLNDGLVRF